MPETRKIIRVFLASPGDLVDERVAVAEVVAEINDNWADFLGYQIELMGWEDTVSRHRRPQEIINQELDRCELFIGMMWKKWGTPPDKDGKYTSGFQEEYDRAVSRREESGIPEISMFFKKIADEFLDDRGPDLIKVLDFRKELIDGKTQLFQEFAEPSDLTSIVRKCLTQYLVDVKKQDEFEETSYEAERQSDYLPREEDTDDSREVTSPFSAQGFHFLSDFVRKIQDQDSSSELSACDIARFRLLSCSISKSGNDDRYIGVHDLNILFANREALDLGPVEISSLTRAGFKQLSSENAPLWHWFARTSGERLALLYSAFGATEAEKQGAILVLDRLGLIFPEDGSINKQVMVSEWFSEDSPNSVRNAAINYLSNHGDTADITYIESEYDRNESYTSRTALEGMIKLSSRVNGRKSAALLAISKQFDLISSDILSDALSGVGELDATDLKLALSHRNAEIRLSAFEELVARHQLADDEKSALLEDDSAEIRFAVVEFSLQHEVVFSDSEVKKLLVRPKKRGAFGALSRATQTDEEGEKYYEMFESNRLRTMGSKALQKLVDKALFYNDRAYFVLTDKYFTKWGGDLRKNIDDQFVAYFDERVQRFEQLDPKGEYAKAVEWARGMEQTIRKKLVRKGLDTLCRKGQKKDLARIRSNISSDLVGGSIAEFEYMAKFGGWEDVEALANLEPETTGRNALAIWQDPAFEVAKATTIYKLGRADANRLFRMNIPTHVKIRILSMCSEATFSTLNNEVLFKLLNDNSDQLRKSTSLMAVRVFSLGQLKVLLETYVSTAEYRYYNVIHWLDLGVSMPRKVAKKVAYQALH